MIGTIKAYAIAITLAGLVSAAGLHLLSDSRTKARLKATTALADTQRATIDQLKSDVTRLGTLATDLRTSRDTTNDRMRTLITDNNAAVDAEVERRKRVAMERDKAKEALRIALDAIATESETDVEFKAWLAQPAPAAAWDRLRDATSPD